MKFVLLAFVLIASSAHADMILHSNSEHAEGGLVGNGGGTVVCRNADKSIRSIELLDYYEAKVLRGVEIDMGDIPGSWQTKIAAVIQRMDRISHIRNILYKKFADKFEEETLFLRDVEFSTVPDTGHIAVPKGCAFEQAAIQKAPRFTGDKRYFINIELWEAMDDTQRAGLVLHEIVYREGLGYGHSDSIGARFLTALFSSKKILTIDYQEFFATLSQAHYELADIQVPIKNFSAWLDLSKLLQLLDPDAAKLEGRIELNQHVPLMVGRCSLGCDTFEPYKPSLIHQGVSVEWQLSMSDYLLSFDHQNFGVGFQTEQTPMLVEKLHFTLDVAKESSIGFGSVSMEDGVQKDKNGFQISFEKVAGSSTHLLVKGRSALFDRNEDGVYIPLLLSSVSCFFLPSLTGSVDWNVGEFLLKFAPSGAILDVTYARRKGSQLSDCTWFLNHVFYFKDLVKYDSTLCGEPDFVATFDDRGALVTKEIGPLTRYNSYISYSKVEPHYAIIFLESETSRAFYKNDKGDLVVTGGLATVQFNAGNMVGSFKIEDGAYPLFQNGVPTFLTLKQDALLKCMRPDHKEQETVYKAGERAVLDESGAVLCSQASRGDR